MRRSHRLATILCGLACGAAFLAGCGRGAGDAEGRVATREEPSGATHAAPGAPADEVAARGPESLARGRSFDGVDEAILDSVAPGAAREVSNENDVARRGDGRRDDGLSGSKSGDSKSGELESGDSESSAARPAGRASGPAAQSAVGGEQSLPRSSDAQKNRVERLQEYRGEVLRLESAEKDNRAAPTAARPAPVRGVAVPADRANGAVPAPLVLGDPFRVDPGHNTEAYDSITENAFRVAKQEPLSTFSIDVDTASYSNVRRFLTQNMLPPAGSVRIEEMVNYFAYEYPQPEGDVPFSVNVEVAGCPWTRSHLLARIALQGRTIETDKRPASNLVFLIDVSGSMSPPNKLPLVKEGLRLLVEQLGENDRVAIVVYASASGLVLDSTTADNKESILAALDNLSAGGSTNGGQGIQLAYQTAVEHFIEGGVNRVVLCTDGDFNVGVTNQSELVSLIEDKAKSGVFLSVLGFGMGNYKDSNMEKLADKGNGNYAYVDTRNEAKKVLVDQMTGTLITIAKDVKIQVDFNPAKVKAYRLVGYENRMLKNEDFRDDAKDAGEIGAGHRVTALYEIVPVGVESAAKIPDVEPSKYQAPKEPTPAADTNELLTVRLRHKRPDGDTSTEIRAAVTVEKPARFDEASDDYQFAASVAEFGMLLRGSEHKGEANFDHVVEVSQATVGPDPFGYRAEFVELVKKARALAQQGGR
ncbi:MAG: VWA domain-containing protein [Planctomycetales bacterium]